MGREFLSQVHASYLLEYDLIIALGELKRKEPTPPLRLLHRTIPFPIEIFLQLLNHICLLYLRINVFRVS